MAVSDFVQRSVDVLRTTFKSLENRNYRWYWFSTLGAYTGMQTSVFIQSYLVYSLSDSAFELGKVNACLGIPLLLLSPWGGAIADRIDKRTMLIVTQILTSSWCLALAILIATDAIQVWHIYITSTTNGIIMSFNLPSRQAIIPQLVKREYLTNAIALGSGAMNSTRIFAPALAGALVSPLGEEGVYFFMVGCYIISTGLMFLVKPLGTPVRSIKTSIRSDLGQGLSYVSQRPILLTLLSLAFMSVVFGLPYLMLMPVFAEDVLNVGASGMGKLMAMTGAGALIGSIAIAYFGDLKRKGLLLLIGSALFGVFLVFFARSTSYHLSLILLMAVGASNVVYMTLNNTLTQLHTDDNMRGRVMGLHMMTVGLMPIGTLGASALADSVGAPFAISVGGGAIILCTLIVAVLRSEMRRL